LPAVPRRELIVRRTDLGMSDVADPDRRAVAVADDRVIEIGELRELVVRLQRIGLLLAF
jgi:hypothetical protein